MMRWTITLPVYFLQNSISKHPAFIYFFPIVYSTISAVFCYLISVQTTGRRIVGFMAALFFILLPQNISAGAQFFPMGPAVMYLLIAAYCALRFLDDRKTRWIFFTAIFWFCSWGAKVTMLIYVPAFCLFFFLVTYFKSDNLAERKFVKRCIHLMLPCTLFLLLCDVIF